MEVTPAVERFVRHVVAHIEDEQSRGAILVSATVRVDAV